MLFEVVVQVLVFSYIVGKNLGVTSVEKVQLEYTDDGKIEFTMAKSILNLFIFCEIDFRMPNSSFVGKV